MQCNAMQRNAICYVEKSHQMNDEKTEKYLHQKPNHRNQVVQFKEAKSKRENQEQTKTDLVI